MRYILIVLLLSGCYTKKGALERFCKNDTTTVVVHDTIITDSIHTDTVFESSVDTVILTKENLTIKYIKVGEKVYLSGSVKSDTIYRTKYIKVALKCPTQSNFEKAKDIWNWLLVAFILGCALGCWIMVKR